MIAGQQLGYGATKLLPSVAKLKDLRALYRQFAENGLRPAPHQREPRWTKIQIAGYIDSIKKCAVLPGCFETYQLKTQGENWAFAGGPTVWLNDGHNRLVAIHHFLTKPEQFGDTLSKAEYTLEATNVAVNHHHYNNHREAHTDFVLVNIGAVGTPYEQLRGLLFYMGDKEELWESYKNLFEQLHLEVDLQAARVAGRAATSTKARHRDRRHDFGLFYRFMSEDAHKNNYGITLTGLRATDVLKGKLLEDRLVSVIKDISLSDLALYIEKFGRAIAHETATIKEIWSPISNGATIQRLCYRYLLDVALWKRYARRSVNEWCDFLRLFLTNTGGTSVFWRDKEKTKRTLISVGNLTTLDSFSRYTGGTFHEDKPARARHKRDQVPAGYDISHKMPFSTHGEGATMIEAASINRARGAQPIDQT